ncbi:MAG: 50S ribosomal protein L24 [Candidatus Sumerlaeia bacterium]|nr:50S ribosomal protein L24 [Candidatus Sumerlaeia bacterium]
MKNKLRKDDLVEVTSGNDRAQKSKGQAPTRGRILEVLREKDMVIVEGVNLRTYHEKVRQTKEGRSGGIDQREAPIHISNVAIVDPKTDKPVRVGSKVVDGRRVRVTVGRNASGTPLDQN